MAEIVLQGFYVSTAASGAPADVQFSPDSRAPQPMPPHMAVNKITVNFRNGFDCATLAPVASCGTYQIIIRRAG